MLGQYLSLLIFFFISEGTDNILSVILVSSCLHNDTTAGSTFVINNPALGIEVSYDSIIDVNLLDSSSILSG